MTNMTSTSSQPRSSARMTCSERGPRGGFTLIELLVVLAIIAILIALMLPVVKKAQQIHARSLVCDTMKSMHPDMLDWWDRGIPGEFPYPNSDYFVFHELAWNHDLDGPYQGYDPQRVIYYAHGHEISYIAKDMNFGFELHADPVDPGFVFDAHLWMDFYDGICRIEELEDTNDVQQLQRQALQEIAGALLTPLDDGSSFDPRDLIPFVSDSETVAMAFSLLDTGGGAGGGDDTGGIPGDGRPRDGRGGPDGIVTINEILDSPLISPELIAAIWEELQLEVFLEHHDGSIGVSLEDLHGDPAGLFSYENLADLTDSYADSRGTSHSLCRKLLSAQRAEDPGRFNARDNILEAYQHQADAQAGKSLELYESETLSILAEVLMTDGDPQHPLIPE